jgi:hypothetical protein
MRTYAAISPSFFSGDAAAYRSLQPKFGQEDMDPDRGGYHLNRIHWNSETGCGSFSTTDALPDGWMDLTPHCNCEESSPCQCR